MIRSMIVLGLVAIAVTLAGPLPHTRAAQPGGTPLPAGCSNVTLTWPGGTALGTVATGIAPATALESVWRYDAAGQRFLGYSPNPAAPSDLLTVGRLDAVFICTTANAQLTQPALGSSPAPATPTPGPTPAPTATGPLTNCDVPATGIALDAEEQALLGLINAYRGQLGLPAFQVSPTLQRVAAWKATSVVQTGQLAHDDPGRTWEERFIQCGYPDSARFSENLGDTNGTVQLLMTTWQASPAHDPNMREPGFTYIGVARAPAAGGAWVWVTTFGSDPR